MADAAAACERRRGAASVFSCVRSCVRAFELAFERVAQGAMADCALANPALRVEAIDFAPTAAEPQVLLGVLVTPWAMNLVRLPAGAEAAAGMARPGHRVCRHVHGAEIEFLGADVAAAGAHADPAQRLPHEACSLFSAMHAFTDQQQARETAREVLRLLQAPEVSQVQRLAAVPPERALARCGAADAPLPAAVPARRAFLFGRGARA